MCPWFLMHRCIFVGIILTVHMQKAHLFLFYLFTPLWQYVVVYVF